MKIFGELSLSKYFDNIKHKLKEFRMRPPIVIKLQGRQRSFNHAEQTEFILATYKKTKYATMQSISGESEWNFLPKNSLKCIPSPCLFMLSDVEKWTQLI